MGNCLVKFLNATVDNSDLEYFDSLQIKVDWSLYSSGGVAGVAIIMTNDGVRSVYFGGVGCTIKVLSNGVVGSSASAVTTEYTIPEQLPSTIAVYPVDRTKPTEFLVIGLDKVTKLNIRYPNGSWMKFPNRQVDCPNLQPYGTDGDTLAMFKAYRDGDMHDVSHFYANYADKENIKSFTVTDNDAEWIYNTYLSTDSLSGYVNLTGISAYYAVGVGDIANLSGLTKLTSLALRRPGVYGDIKDIGPCTLLTAINLNSSSVTGTVEDFVAAQCAAGRTSASNVHLYSTKITYLNNGVPTVVGAGGKYISWNKVGDNYNIVVTS